MVTSFDFNHSLSSTASVSTDQTREDGRGNTIAGIVLIASGLIGCSLSLLALGRDFFLGKTLPAIFIGALVWVDFIGVFSTAVLVFNGLVQGEKWLSGSPQCAIQGFFTTAFGMSSGAVVTIMSLDRFASLHCPFLYNKYASPKLARVFCILLTLFCTILASLPFMNVGDYVLNENSQSFCHFDLFPADRAGFYFLLGLATFGVLLTSVMTFCNIFVFIVVLRIKRRMSKLLPCEMNARRALRCAFRQEERMAKLVALVSVVFLVTWLPVTIRIFCNTLRLHLSQNMDNLSFRLVMVNFLLDPFTYVLFTRGFKRKFQQSITGFREYLRDKHASQKRKIQTSRIENASFAPDTTVLGPALCIAQSSVIRVAVRPVPANLVQTSLPT
ncbi:prostacyclin receptor-like [Montipora foliosa]|uniref:prostacyclin receptor-like n=1 Tax=Montipora foliosa TaxID=591990 RepID=UPI0035F135FD